jgi:hypothetical protein
MLLGAQRCAVMLASTLAVVVWQTTLAVVPASATVVNDACRTPIVIDTLPFQDMRDTGSATTAPDDPLQSCAGGSINAPPARNFNSVWYSYTATAELSLVVSAARSNYNPVVSVWTGTCGNLSETVCTTDRVPATFPLMPGQTILIEVTQPSAPGGGYLVLDVAAVPPAANDLCDAPTVITTVPFNDLVDTRAATTSASDPLQSCSYGVPAQNSRSVWYRYTPPYEGKVVVSTERTNYETVLSAYTGSCTGRREVACGSDAISFLVTGGRPVFLEATQFGNLSGGSLLLNVNGPVPNDACATPAVITALPFSDSLDATLATASPSDPAPSCAPSPPAQSIWYSLTAPTSGVLVAGASSTTLTAYAGDCGALTELGCDVVGDSNAFVAIPVAAGQTVRLGLTGSDISDVFIAVDIVQPPPNDDCTAATAVTTRQFSEPADTRGAATSPSDPLPSCAVVPASNTVWYRVTAPVTGALVAFAQPMVIAYSGTCDALTEIGCGPRGQVGVPVIAGQTVLVEVAEGGGTHLRDRGRATAGE